MRTGAGSVRSMSGFGRGAARAAGFRVACEIRTVNQRGLDVSLSLPDGMGWADPVLRRWIASSLSRGRVDVSVGLAEEGGGRDRVLDAKKAARVAREMKALAGSLGLEPPRIEAVLSVPGVVRDRESAILSGRLIAPLRAAYAEAMKRVLAMRRREGAALAGDIRGRLDALERLSASVRAAWPEAAARTRDRITARLEEALDRMGTDRSRAKDIVAAIERGDVSEELTRLASHISQCRTALKSGSPAGRQLDFLAAELHREVNTTGAKSTDAGITGTVVAMKEEVERIREQAANVE